MNKQQIDRIFDTFKQANRELVADGEMTREEEQIVNGVGALAHALGEQYPQLVEIEFKALLTKAQDFGKLLCGCIDRAEGRDTQRAAYYKQELIPVMVAYVQFVAQNTGEQAAEAV